MTNNYLGKCMICDETRALRYVKGKGMICKECTDDDDLVACIGCGEFRPLHAYGVHRVVDGVKYYFNLCPTCKLHERKSKVGHCESCGRKTQLRFTSRGLICVECIDEDDLVLCEGCGKMIPLDEFNTLPRRHVKGGIVRRRVCPECEAMKLKPVINPFRADHVSNHMGSPDNISDLDWNVVERLLKGKERGKCVRCGDYGWVRHVKDEGWVCAQCLGDDDLVQCKDCLEHYPYSEYRVIKNDYRPSRSRSCSNCAPQDYLVGKCESCGLKTKVRVVSGRGVLCHNCIGLDDYVMCPVCKVFYPWREYQETGKGYRLRVCPKCYSEGKRCRRPKARIVRNGRAIGLKDLERWKEEGLLREVDGVWRIRLDCAVELMLGDPAGPFVEDLYNKIRSGEYSLVERG